MSKVKAKEYLLSGIYNLEKNYGKMGDMKANELMFKMALGQLKDALAELTDECNAELKTMGLKEREE